MVERYTWRRATQGDEVFVFALFSAQLRAELEFLGLSPQELESLIAMQYQARRVGYAQAYPAATDMILCRVDGTPVGRQLIERQNNAYRLIDMAISEEARNQGIGSWAIRQVQCLAAAEKLPIRLVVLHPNRASRFYARLGFLPISGNEIASEMEWQSRLPSTSASNKQTPLSGFTECKEPGPREQRA